MNKYMKTAIDEARTGISEGHGGPFGCVIVKDGEVVGQGHNEVVKQKDPTRGRRILQKLHRPLLFPHKLLTQTQTPNFHHII